VPPKKGPNGPQPTGAKGPVVPEPSGPGWIRLEGETSDYRKSGGNREP